MTDDTSLNQKRLVRSRALRAAQVVAIVASLTGAGCSERTEPGHATDAGGSDSAVADLGADLSVNDSALPDLGQPDLSPPADLGRPDLGAPDAGGDAAVADAALADTGVDAALADLGVIEVDADVVNPCIDEGGGIDFDCCVAMDFPPGCPVIGPFVPPDMQA